MDRMTSSGITNPLVSIGVPVYNGEKTIREALTSLQEQTYANVEIVVCDNASTDRTQKICQELAAKDPRIHYYRNGYNIGLNQNFRRVFELSSGEYFMWTGADDVRPHTAVEACLQALLNNPSAVMAHGPVLTKREGEKSLGLFTNEVDLSQAQAAARISAFIKQIQYNAMLYGLYRRAALAKGTLGLYHFAQDYLLCLQMCLLGPVEYVRTPMIVYRENSSIPLSDCMYFEVPLTARSMLNSGGARMKKCWTVLIMGCYYFSTIHGVPLTERIGGILALVRNFGWRYRSRLAKEIIFQIFRPLAWFNVTSRRLAHRWPSCLRLARKLQTFVAQD
jgi:glycosyltransferase involved in cell wall biosynthesis